MNKIPKESDIVGEKLSPSNNLSPKIKKYIPTSTFFVQFLISSIALGFVAFFACVIVVLLMWLYIVSEMLADTVLIQGFGGSAIIWYFAKILFQNQLKEKISIEFIKRIIYPSSKKVIVIELIVIILIIVSMITYPIKPINTFARSSLREFTNAVNVYLNEKEFTCNSLNNSNTSNNENSNKNTVHNSKVEFILSNSKEEIPYSLLQLVYLEEVQFNDISDYAESIYHTGENLYDKNELSLFVQSLENDFYTSIEQAKQYASANGQNDEWYMMLPNETDLIHLIKSAEEFSKEYKNFFVYNRISNYYQKLALEYINQDSEEESAKYYYMKSIEYDYKSIEYADNKYDYNKAIERLRERYNDIYAYCLTENDVDERSRVREICETIE